MSMRWGFTRGQGGMRELGLVGPEGEFYFHPSKAATIKGIQRGQTAAKPQVVPIFPYNSVLVPHSSDWLNIFEMKHRQLVDDVVKYDGTFGFIHYSQGMQKLALVGTLAKIKDRKILADGRSFVVIEGIKRFYLKESVSEKPYIRARVQTFDDWSENLPLMRELEDKVFKEVRANLKMMKILYPAKNYKFSNAILKFRPQVRPEPGVRQVFLTEVEGAEEVQRCADFSFAVIEMIDITPAKKLALMQEHIVERRLASILEVLENGSAFMRDSLKEKGIMRTDAEIERQIYQPMDYGTEDIDSVVLPPSSWTPENYVGGAWQQMPILM